MDLVDEQHIIGFQIGQQRGQIAGALQHGARCLSQIDAHLKRDDMSQRGLAQTGRAEQERVIERFAALAGRSDENFQLITGFLLTDIFIQLLRPQCALDRFLIR